MSVIKWLLFLPTNLFGGALAVLCSPFAAFLSMSGKGLPDWLRWIQTHDNSIDTLWQQPHHMERYTTLRGVHPEWCRQSPLLLLAAYAIKGAHDATTN